MRNKRYVAAGIACLAIALAVLCQGGNAISIGEGWNLITEKVSEIEIPIDVADNGSVTLGKNVSVNLENISKKVSEIEIPIDVADNGSVTLKEGISANLENLTSKAKTAGEEGLNLIQPYVQNASILIEENNSSKSMNNLTIKAKALGEKGLEAIQSGRDGTKPVPIEDVVEIT